MKKNVGTKKIALFIDSENISYKLIDMILKKLSAEGEVCIKKAYGDWRKERMRKWDEILQKYSIDPIHIITGNANKSNSSDIRIAIDVMNTLYDNKMHCIALATSDSDFAPLAQEIRTKGVQSMGFGEPKSREDLRNAFTHFEELTKAAPKLSKPKEMLEILKKAVVMSLDERGKAALSKVERYLRFEARKIPNDFGESHWFEVFESFQQEFKICDENGKIFVAIKPCKKSKTSR